MTSDEDNISASQIEVYKKLSISHLRAKKMTVKNIMYIIAKVMPAHVGRSNAIRDMSLFKAVYGQPQTETFADDFRWEYIKKAMTKLRGWTKCFIINDRGWYFIPETMAEADIYVKNVEKVINRMRRMQERAVIAIDESWHLADWVKESKLLSSVDSKKQQIAEDRHPWPGAGQLQCHGTE